MGYWSFFFTLRKVVLSIVALLCLSFGIGLAIYLSHEWKYFDAFQRIFILVATVVDLVSSVVIYLMIVVILKVWADFARVVILFAFHAAIAVLFSVFGSRFSCDIFSSRATCNDIRIVSLAVSWTICGLLLFQGICLCIMSRLNFPLDDSKPGFWPPEHKREPSITSVDSDASSDAALLRRDIEADPALEPLPARQNYSSLVDLASLASTDSLPVHIRAPPPARSRRSQSYGTISPGRYSATEFARTPTKESFSTNPYYARQDTRVQHQPLRSALHNSYAELPSPRSRQGSNASSTSSSTPETIGTPLEREVPRSLTSRPSSIRSVTPSLFYAEQLPGPRLAHIRPYVELPMPSNMPAEEPQTQTRGTTWGEVARHRKQSSLPVILCSVAPQIPPGPEPTGALEYSQWRQLVMNAAVGVAQ